MAKKALQFDEIGYWSEIKLEIVKKYAAAYSTILSNQPAIKGHLYVDGLAGAGTHISKTTGEEVAGSPLNAMRITPPFSELHFIDLDGTRNNFMIMDANMNVLWKDPGKVKLAQKARMDAVWGDESWRTHAYERARICSGSLKRKPATTPWPRPFESDCGTLRGSSSCHHRFR